MQIEWSYAGQLSAGHKALLRHYPANEFASPRRSTVPLLSYWRDPVARVRELSDAMGFAEPEQACLDFEHEVPVQRGTGRPSCTDLLLTADTVTLAIEAKSTEPRYPDVTNWLGKPATANRQAVLAGWLDLLATCTVTRLGAGKVAALPYQLIHRAASACTGDEHCRWLVYQVFEVDATKRSMYLADLQALATVLGPSRSLGICLVECSARPSARQMALEDRWDAGSRDLEVDVLAGLQAGALLSPRLERVTVI